MNRILTFIIGRRMVANVLTLAVLVLGLFSITRLPLAELPIVDLGKADIETSYPGASAEDVEANVTSRIEKELLSVSAIKKFQSVSEEGQSSINLELKSDVTNVEQAYQDIRDAVARVSDLPSGVTEAPVVRTKKSSSLDFMVVGIAGDLPYAELRQHARALELALRRLPGIGDVMPKDLRQQEYWIQLEPEQLARYGLTLNDVADSISQRNVLMSGGSLESYKTAQDLLTMSELKTLADLKQIEVSREPVVRLSDIGENIVQAFERPSNYASINGKQVIGFDLRTSDAADVTATAAAVKALLDREQQRLGDKVELLVGFDLSNETQAKFEIVRDNGLVGLALVLVTLGLLLNRHIALWVAVSIPFSLLGVLVLLPPLGQVLDSYTLAAMILIIGIIVDDAVVVSEKIMNHVESGKPVNEAILRGIRDILPAVVTSILTTFLAFMPLMFLPGNTGKMLYVMPMTVGLALLFSLIDVMVVLPAHLRPVLQRCKGLGKVSGTSPSPRQKAFHSLLTTLVKRRYLTVPTISLIILGSGWFSFNQLPYIFFPTQGAYLIEVEAEVAANANIDDAWKYTRALEQILAQDGDVVRSWYGQIGAPYSSFLISLVPAEQRDISADELLERWEEKAEQLEGFVDIEFEVDAGGPPKGRPVDINVAGGTDQQRQTLANDLAQWLEEQSGIRRVFQASEDERPIVVVDINYELLNRYGISVYDLARTLRLGVDGERISRVFAGDEEIHYRLLLDENDRNLSELEQLQVRAGDGRLVDIRELVNWQESVAPAAIKHFNGERSIRVSAAINANLTDPLAIEEAMRGHFSNQDYGSARLISNGQAQETREALSGLTMALAIALIAIWLALILLFDSVWESLLIMSIVPFGLAASATVLFIHGEPLSFFAIVGVIGLVGVMVNNSLVLICHYQQQRKQHKVQDIVSFSVDGSLARSRAVMLTTVTTVAGLIPLAYGLGGYDNYMGPIALVMGWGITVASVVTLVVVPCLYAMSIDLRTQLHGKRVAIPA